jgi:hypothetical protein
MKRLPLLLFLFTTVALFAQEPGNNLRKTIPQLRQSFPDLIVWGYERGGIQNYKSPEADILFETKNGIVIAEFASFEGEDGYLQGLYQSLLKSFSKNAKTYRWGGNKNSISFFYSYGNGCSCDNSSYA